MAQSQSLILADAGATERFGRLCAAALRATQPGGLVVYLEGELGAGKTTLVRGLLAGLGHAGRVPSPTYTLVEPYLVDGQVIQHVDLYRLRDPRELEEIGLAEALAGAVIGLIEWPDHGAGQLPAADLVLRLELAGQGRAVAWQALSAAGQAMDQFLRQQLARGLGEPPVTTGQ